MVLYNMLQAFGVARQMLSLVAGSAIDEYLLSQLRLLRQPHTLARLIHALQTKLWPGGSWFQHTAKYMQQHPVSSLHSSSAKSIILLMKVMMRAAEGPVMAQQQPACCMVGHLEMVSCSVSAELACMLPFDTLTELCLLARSQHCLLLPLLKLLTGTGLMCDMGPDVTHQREAWDTMSCFSQCSTA